jgi:hypothetical protein
MTAMWKRGVGWFGALAILAGAVGCAPEGAVDEDGDSTSDEVRAATALVGSWEGGGTIYRTLTFAARTAAGQQYEAARYVTCVRAPCDPVAERGTYTATSTRIRLTSGGATTTYRYVLAGDVLTLTDGRGGRDTLHRTPRSSCALRCASGSHCELRPVECVRAPCEPVPTCVADAAGACRVDADCRATADYCGGCNCRALTASERVPVCTGSTTMCFADPCLGATARCNPTSHRCELAR